MTPPGVRRESEGKLTPFVTGVNAMNELGCEKRRPLLMAFCLLAKIGVSRAANLETWSRHDWKDGVQIESLNDLETLVIETKNSTYEITVISGSEREIVVRGGEFFPQKTAAHFSGASLGGSFLKIGGIYVGMNMEILHEGQCIITSPVQTISVVV